MIVDGVYTPTENKKCRKCEEVLPASKEFYFAQKTTVGSYYFCSPCKACRSEQASERLGRKCIVEGCNEVRVDSTHPRCRKHQSEFRSTKARR